MNRVYLWILLGGVAFGLLNASSCKKEVLPNFIGEWQGTFSEYETRGDTVALVQEWLFDFNLENNGTGGFGRYKPVSWKLHAAENEITIIIMDNPGGIYPDVETRFDILVDDVDVQIWSFKYEGRPREIDGEEVFVPVERIWKLVRK